MDHSSFIHLLEKELRKELPEQKYIIRFRHKSVYKQCMQCVKQMRSSNPLFKAIQPLELIDAISCPFFSRRKLTSFSFISSVEIDTKLKIHGISANPPGRTSSRIKVLLQTIPWGVRKIHAPQAWRFSQGNKVGIGVIDTGIDYTHPDLQGVIGKGINLVQNGMIPIDDNGHGTHISGTIAAASNGYGILGVAPRAVIHPVKAFDRTGSAYVSNIILGLDWCVKHKIPIINMSFGMKNYSKSLEYAVRRAIQAGIVVVASSGNDGNRNKIDYPAIFPFTISVGATGKQKKIAPFSNRGRHIDIYAPGEQVYSTWLHGGYHEMSGTSMATSHVSGVVALMLAMKPSLTPKQIKYRLRKYATFLFKSDDGQLIREVNARKAVEHVLDKKSASRVRE